MKFKVLWVFNSYAMGISGFPSREQKPQFEKKLRTSSRIQINNMLSSKQKVCFPKFKEMG